MAETGTISLTLQELDNRTPLDLSLLYEVRLKETAGTSEGIIFAATDLFTYQYSHNHCESNGR